jgi:hypothetical protein
MLTDVALKALKPLEKIYQVAYRDGMYVRVTPRDYGDRDGLHPVSETR